jgi:hypothetical protein
MLIRRFSRTGKILLMLPEPTLSPDKQHKLSQKWFGFDVTPQ